MAGMMIPGMSPLINVPNPPLYNPLINVPKLQEQKMLAKFANEALNDIAAGGSVTRPEAQTGQENINVPVEQGVQTLKSEEQEFTSEDTSRNQIAAPFKKLLKDGSMVQGGRNADIGGGKYDKATDFLKEQGVENLVVDTFNRSKEFNFKNAKKMIDNPTDTATVNNVLNVIKEESQRDKVISQAKEAIKDDGEAYFSVYKGAGDGVGKETKDGWQNNRLLKDYISEIGKHFKNVSIKNDVIRASGKKNGSTPDKNDKVSYTIKIDGKDVNREVQSLGESTEKLSTKNGVGLDKKVTRINDKYYVIDGKKYLKEVDGDDVYYTRSFKSQSGDKSGGTKSTTKYVTLYGNNKK